MHDHKAKLAKTKTPTIYNIEIERYKYSIVPLI